MCFADQIGPCQNRSTRSRNSRSLGGRPLERLEKIAFGLADYGVPVHIVDAGKPDELMARLAAAGPPLAA